jgi:hypothetical protein
MKKMLLAALIIIAASVQAQAPQGIAFQAIARNLNGSPIANRSLQVRFSVLDSAANGTAVYVETHNTTTNTLGLFSLSVGMGTAVTNTFVSINWGKNNKFLKTEIDADGTGTWLDLGTQQMMSVPYALYAGTANNISNGFKHYIGEYYGGGVVFSVWKDITGDEHGLIVALNNIDSSIWSNVDTGLIGTTAQSVNNGKSNTLAIINQTGHITSAAYMCDTSTLNGYTDWYLPAIEELQLLYSNRNILNKVLAAINNADEINSSYFSKAIWSSTEYTATEVLREWAFPVNQAFPYHLRHLKKSFRLVRAIRSF